MEHVQFKITGIRNETPLSRSYFIEEINGRVIPYKAGQFLTLIVSLHGREVRRSYSIAAAPGVDSTLFFTVKRLENGELSRHILDTFKQGDIITTLPPTGRFIITGPQAGQLIFIAAGSGITPIFGLIKQALHDHDKRKVLLINQNNSEAESLFNKQLQELQQHWKDRFQVHNIFSNPAGNQLKHQRLNNSLLESILLQHNAPLLSDYYVCGPESFMRMVQFTLTALGADNDHIKKENFFATPPPPPFMADATPHQVVIHYHNKTHRLQVSYPETILNAALKKDIRLPYSCRGGRCSTCTAVCIKGNVKMSINDVLTPADLKSGLILTCVSYPESDVEITYETDKMNDE